MKDWTFFFLDGTTETISGPDPITAFNKNYGGGAVRAVDFYDEAGSESDWKWDKDKHTWVRNEEKTNDDDNNLRPATDSDPV